MFEFIEKLQISDDDKAKLRSLGASSAPALLSLMQASGSAIDAFIGQKTAVYVKQQLAKSLAVKDYEVLSRPAPVFRTGALISPQGPQLQPAKYDVAKRDEMFKNVQQLKIDRNQLKGTNLASVQSKIDELEQEISHMLNL
jgi:hypothetical protein